MHELPPGDGGRPTYTEIWHYPTLGEQVVVDYVGYADHDAFDPDPSVDQRPME